MIWAVIFALALVALLALVQPFFRQHTAVSSLEDEDYLAAQLQDVERDRMAGLLTEEEAAAATAEARRRLLDHARAAKEKTPPAAAQGMSMASVMLIAAAPIAATAIYMALGNPTLAPAGPEDARMAPPLARETAASATAPSVAESIERLAAQLEDNPDDLEGWIVLADSYAATDRFDEAARAFARAVALAPERAFLHAGLGEAIAMANNGVVNDEARAAFDRALERDPNEPRARFYLALASYQAGDADEALGALVALANDAPPDAPWINIVGDQVRTIAGELDRPLEDLALTDAARAALVGGDTPGALEARIAAGGAPYTDWLALIDAYASAGDSDKAADALARARERYAAAPFVLQELDAVAQRLGVARARAPSSPRRGPPVRPERSEGPTREQMEAAAQMSEQDRAQMIEGMVESLAARLESESDDFEGWMMLGRSYDVLGRPQESAEAFARAVELQPDGTAARIAHARALLSKLEAEGAPIGPEAEEALKAIEQRNPDEPFALYFLGVSAQQDGDEETARAYWEKLLAQLPDDSEDAARVREMVEGL